MAGIGDIAELATKLAQDRAVEAARATAVAGGKAFDEAAEKDVRKKIRFSSEDVSTIFAALRRKTIEERDVVSIQGFGNFRLVDRKATKARNPQTGAQFDVAASLRFKFTPSKTLREEIASKKDVIPAAKARASKKAAPAAPAATPAPAASAPTA